MHEVAISLIEELSLNIKATFTHTRKLLYDAVKEATLSSSIERKELEFPLPMTLYNQENSFSFKIANRYSLEELLSYFDSVKEYEVNAGVHQSHYSWKNADTLSS